MSHRALNCPMITFARQHGYRLDELVEIIEIIG
jgi:hypothetical protein